MSLQCKKATTLLKSLGFIINYKKSSLIFSQTCKYLGFIINSVSFGLELDNKKRKEESYPY